MTDSHANDDPPGVDTLLVDAAATAPAVVRNTARSSPAGDATAERVDAPADVAPELHEDVDT